MSKVRAIVAMSTLLTAPTVFAQQNQGSTAGAQAQNQAQTMQNQNQSNLQAQQNAAAATQDWK